MTNRGYDLGWCNKFLYVNNAAYEHKFFLKYISVLRYGSPFVILEHAIRENITRQYTILQ